MIDMTSRPPKRYVINRCHYRDHDRYPEGKMIDHTVDHGAHKTSRGDWMCGVSTTGGLYEMNRGL
jgi:hypothetical protein